MQLCKWMRPHNPLAKYSTRDVDRAAVYNGDPCCTFPLCLHAENSDTTTYLYPCSVNKVHPPPPPTVTPLLLFSACHFHHKISFLENKLGFLVAGVLPKVPIFSSGNHTFWACVYHYNAARVGVCLHVYGLCHMILFFVEPGFLRSRASRLKIYARAFMVVYGFLLYVCIDTHCFILCLSVFVDDCVLEVDYTWRNVYICAIKLVN